MPITKHFDQLNRMHALIKFRRTGTPDQFAKRIGVSRSQLFKLLAQLRQLGGPIYFSKIRESYAYHRRVELRLGYIEIGPQSTSAASLHKEATVVPMSQREPAAKAAVSS